MHNGRFLYGSAALAIALTLAPPAAAQCTPVTGENRQPGVCTCVMGPVTVEAPVCEITSQTPGDTREDYVEWRDGGGIFYTVVLSTPKRPASFKGYLARWRHHHKCTAKEQQFGPPSHLEGKAGTSIPPQTTWGGVCAGGDSYIARAAALGAQVVEIHVSRRKGIPKGPSEVEQLFPGLIERVRLSQPPRR
jgi:hypothetical protein